MRFFQAARSLYSGNPESRRKSKKLTVVFSRSPPEYSRTPPELYQYLNFIFFRQLVPSTLVIQKAEGRAKSLPSFSVGRHLNQVGRLRSLINTLTSFFNIKTDGNFVSKIFPFSAAPVLIMLSFQS
jgi:hypothetical protein